MNDEKKKLWYQTWWGVLAIILFLPIFTIWYVWAKTNWSKTIKWVVTAIILILLVIIGSGSGSKQTETSTKETAKETVETKTVDNSLSYNIKYTAKNRYDGGSNYYVLIDPIDLSSDAFKSKIKSTVDKIVKDKGPKSSIELHDNLDSLAVSYKQYGDKSLGRPRTESENQLEAVHFVASFDGELDTNIYKNTLSFFPGATTTDGMVGKYVATEEYNPTK